MMIQHDKLRQFVKQESWPLDVKEWSIELNQDTNCLAFALGLPCADVEKDTFRFTPNSDLERELEKWFSILELDYRRIYSFYEANDDEIIINGYEFISPLTNRRDYHVIRRNLDGTWVHKQGWKDAPCIIAKLNTSSLWCNNMRPKVITYAVKKRSN